MKVRTSKYYVKKLSKSDASADQKKKIKENFKNMKQRDHIVTVIIEWIIQ